MDETVISSSEATADTGNAFSTPVLAAMGGAHWRRCAVLWGIVAVLQVLLLMNHAALDTLLWRMTRWATGDQDAYKWAVYKQAHAGEKDAPFYMTVDPPFTRMVEGTLQGRFYKRTEIFWRVLRALGEPVTTALIIFIVCIYDRRGTTGGLFFVAATAGTGLLGWLIRAIAGRYRPINIDGENSWHFFRGFSETRDLSWPSGHATLAFATAAALAYLSPKGKRLFVIVAAGCAITRVVMQAHFYSDVIFGSALGWTFGGIIMRATDRWFGDEDDVVC